MHSTTAWPHQNCTYNDIHGRTPDALGVFDDPDPELAQLYQRYGDHLFPVRSIACTPDAAGHFASVLTAAQSFANGIPFEDCRRQRALPLPAPRFPLSHE